MWRRAGLEEAKGVKNGEEGGGRTRGEEQRVEWLTE
jgi:hypothetical protein